MRNFKFIFVIAISATAVGLGHTLALRDYLYWRYSWFDMPVHFFGGMLVALTFFFMVRFFTRHSLTLRTHRLYIWGTVLSSLLVGFFWEAFEWQAGLTVMNERTAVDTSGDIFMNMAGAALAFLVYKFIYKEDSYVR
ncbi:MAG: hypothetical protein AAB597_02550 [Patescibacteria group bacterium]